MSSEVDDPKGIFSGIASRYDTLNRVLSLGQEQNWRRQAVEHLPGGRLLDLGSGTGAAAPVFGDREVVALDPEPAMLALSPITERVVGYGEALPFPGESFDAVFSAYVFRNLTSVNDTLAEIHRVLRPGGKAAVVDLARPRAFGLAALHRAGTAVVLPLAGATVGARDEYSYLHRSLDKLAPPEELYASGPLEVERLWRMGPLGFVYGVVLAKPG
ncbi:MAG: class I SAM-dependent methyltransferase [Acidimicrobiia bacterium]|nr:class I SAM-dependent methyltransferase [Acidimicrobiia bacterium]